MLERMATQACLLIVFLAGQHKSRAVFSYLAPPGAFKIQPDHIPPVK